MTSTELKAMAWSWLRVTLAALGAALITVWNTTPDHDLTHWTKADALAFAAAVATGTILTTINALRSGETRFGTGYSKDQPGQ
jgi:hypothetical protein